jgi:hypothetical protein
MFSPRFTKYRLFVCVSLVVGTIVSAQDSNDGYVDSPYRSEPNPWFQLPVFNRGYQNEPLKLTLDSLESKSRKYWSRSDSLKFAQTSMKTGNLELSSYYFHNLKVDYETEETFWWDDVVVHFLNREYNTCLQTIKNTQTGVLERSRLFFFKQICEAKLSSLRDEKWYKTESVLDWEIDSSIMLLDKDSPEFREKVITPLEDLSYVLEAIIRHVHDDDQVIARACLEMGLILDAYISPTQAYIAMSMGRHYAIRDKEILANIKRVKATIVQKKYRIPVFRKYFPRIEYWRFDYQMLKEKIIYEKNDTTTLRKPNLMKEKEGASVPFPAELIVIIGLSIIIVCLILFLKVNQKK